ncbi:MAG: prepilin-type N-terminal cleavage/methylation domain-containing protein [Deltaproteobacteria bacterium]|nr:prepilin-type N-terminal cleavage/methylation domain-containing protein [Deltaproteobacteria bacterium]
MRHLQSSQAYTMIEMVFVITLVGLIASVVSLGFYPVLNSWSLGSPRSTVVNETGYGLGRMVGEMTQLKDKTSIIAANANKFQFVDMNNNNITYLLTGNSLMRNNDILAKGLQSLVFTYSDINELALATPQVSPASTNIWRIKIQMTAVSGGQQISLESQVHPRNIPRS